MKKPSDSLFRLIQAMTPAEKRYFKVHFASDQSRLTELFDFLNQMEEYDEKKVKTAFPNSFSKNLKVHKIQLQDLLLRSLITFKSKRTIRSQLRVGLEEIDLLMEKRLHNLAYDKLMKLKKVALKYEEHSYLVEIGYQELLLLYIKIEKVGMSKHPVFNEIDTNLRTLRKQFDLTLLGNQLNDERRQKNPNELSSDERKEFRRLLHSYPLNEDPEQLNFHAHILYNASKSFVHSLLQEKKEERYFRRRNLELFTEHSHFQKTMAFNYLGVLRNFISACLGERDYPGVMDAVARAEAFAEKFPKMKPHLIFFHEAELEALFEQGNLPEIRKIVEPKILQHLNRHHIGPQRITMVIYLYLAITCQLRGDNQGVQAYIRKMHAAEKDVHDYFWELICIVELLNHFEAGEDFLVERTLHSLSRQKERMKKTSPFFRELLKLFRQLLRHPFERPQLTRAFLTSTEEAPDDFFSSTFRHFKLNGWLIALAENTDFATVFSRPPA